MYISFMAFWSIFVVIIFININYKLQINGFLSADCDYPCKQFGTSLTTRFIINYSPSGCTIILLTSINTDFKFAFKKFFIIIFL